MDESISGQAAAGSNGSERAKLSVPQEGLITTWVDGSLGVVEEVVRAGFGFLEDVRVETQERLGATLDLLEGIDRSMFRVARKTLARVDGISERAISNSQLGWLALLGTIRRTSQGAAGLASETVVAVVGERKATQQLIMRSS
ncbi:hypothetical protein WME95_11330 [Sorangium sp. So ce327]|jgi:hypothetical protein|uniref:hypothetical protein n=1 Tax=unclassified Sorangium TaxID=2621164 RepID=UPI003F645406